MQMTQVVSVLNVMLLVLAVIRVTVHGSPTRMSAASSRIRAGNACVPSKSGGPTDNPVATFYGKTSYPWVDVMVNWSCVFNVKDYDDDIGNAQKAALAAGGGVVYVPAGRYSLGEDFTISSGVILRGEADNVPAKEGTDPGPLKPKSNIVCPDRQYKRIVNSDANATNFGLVHLNLDGCAVSFGPGYTGIRSTLEADLLQYNSSGRRTGSFGMLGLGSHKLVFGCRLQNVAYKYPDPDKPSGNIWPYRFATAISVVTDDTCLIANNLLAESDKKKRTTVKLDARNGSFVTISAEFHYDNRYGISVNRLAGILAEYQESGICPPQPGTVTPKCFPWYFRRGIVIRDNYVYMNGRVGISWTGGGDGKTVGSGTSVTGNHVEIASGTMCWSVDGVHLSRGFDTNENRGYDQCGYASNVIANTAHVNRQIVSDGKYETTDGEGILQQAAGGNDGLRNLWHANNLSGGSSGPVFYYKLFNTIDNIITNNIAANGSMVGFVTDTTHHTVKDNKCSGNIPHCSSKP